MEFEGCVDGDIESIFIDEGFGTLDSHTLNQAISILEKMPSYMQLELRNNLVAMRTPQFRGGTCKAVTVNHNIREVLQSRNKDYKKMGTLIREAIHEHRIT